ncbi:MAG: branched-chain amino acid ABC transporter permease, partial [Pseudomonadota bacterium]
MSVSIFIIWTGWTAVGALAGSVIGDPQRWGLDFAFVAIFIALLGGFWSGNRTVIVWLAAAAASCLTKLLVPGAWYVLVGGLAGMAMAAVLWRPPAERDTP